MRSFLILELRVKDRKNKKKGKKIIKGVKEEQGLAFAYIGDVGECYNSKARLNNTGNMRYKLQPPNFVKCLSRWQAGGGG